MGGGLRPKSVKTVFECVALTAFKEVFSTRRVSACHFHRGQPVFLGINGSGLKIMYETDVMEKKPPGAFHV